MSPTLVLKSAVEELHVVYAEVYAPYRPDSHSDYAEPGVIREAAWAFLRNKKQDCVDSDHNNVQVDSACVVESFIAREGDPTFIPGAWVVGIHIPNDEEWAKVKDGTWNGLSMESYIVRREVEITVDVPPVITGATTPPVDAYPKGPDHTHEFFVAYDEDGNFLGGRTNEQAGHFHTITYGTVTDEVDGHTHRYAYLDNFNIEDSQVED